MNNIDTINIWINENAISASIAAGLGLLAMTVTILLLVRLGAKRKTVQHQIRKLLKPYDYYQDGIFSDGDSQLVQFDYLVLTDKGILLLSIFDAIGQIFAGNKMTEWTVVGEQKRYRLKNPQDLLFDQLAKIRTLHLNTPIQAHIVHTEKTQFSKGTPDHVMTIEEFVDTYRPASGPEMLADWEKMGKQIQVL